MSDKSQPLSQDRFLGAMLGVAVGDALGTTLEFHAPGTFDPVDDIVGGGVLDDGVDLEVRDVLRPDKVWPQQLGDRRRFARESLFSLKGHIGYILP